MIQLISDNPVDVSNLAHQLEMLETFAVMFEQKAQILEASPKDLVTASGIIRAQAEQLQRLLASITIVRSQ